MDACPTVPINSCANSACRSLRSGSAARYEDRVGDIHRHPICRSCDTMFDIDCAIGHSS